MACVLKNVDIVKIISEQYLSYNDETAVHFAKKIKVKKTKEPVSHHFLDVHKSKVKLWANMIDLSNLNGSFELLPLNTTNPCWWCRHSFDTSPIGCPLKFHDKKSINSNIEERMKRSNIKKDDFFETEGLFDSLSCIYTYLEDMCKMYPAKYKESHTLLTLLQLKLTGKIDRIRPAPHWSLLNNYGGHLDITEFRDSIGMVQYKPTVNTSRPYMYPVGRYNIEI